MSIVDPQSWAFLVYGDQSAFLDFLGTHELQHRQFAYTVTAVLGDPTFPSLPLGDYTGPEWHDAHQAIHQGLTDSLGIAGPPDFRSYDFEDKDQWAAYMWLHSQEHVRLREAIGV